MVSRDDFFRIGTRIRTPRIPEDAIGVMMAEGYENLLRNMSCGIAQGQAEHPAEFENLLRNMSYGIAQGQAAPVRSSDPWHERGAFAALQREVPGLKCYEGGVITKAAPPCVLRTGRNVTAINLNNLGLLRVPAAVAKFHALESLHLASNCIREVPPGIPASVLFLDLSDNQIGALPGDLLARLPRLRELDVSGNELAGLPEEWASAGSPSVLRSISVHVLRNDLEKDSDGTYASLLPLLAAEGIGFIFRGVEFAESVKRLIRALQAINTGDAAQFVLKRFADSLGDWVGPSYHKAVARVVSFLWPEILEGLCHGERAAARVRDFFAGPAPAFCMPPDSLWSRDKLARQVFLWLLRERPELVVDRWWSLWQSRDPADRAVLEPLHARVLAATALPTAGGEVLL